MNGKFRPLLVATMFTLGAVPFSAGLEAAPEKKEINITVFPAVLLNLVDYSMVWHGFLEKEGVTGKFVTVANGPAMVASILGGSSDFTAVAPVFAWQLQTKGECIRYLGTGVGSYYSLLAQADLDLPNLAKGFPDSIRDLKGKRIGVVARGAATEVWTGAVLKAAGLDPAKDVTFVGTGGQATAIAAFENKQVDVQFAYPPLSAKLAQGSYKVVANLFNSDVPTFNDMVQSGPATTCEFQQKNPETYKAYCRAYHAAYRFVTDPKNDEAVAKDVARITGVDEAAATKLWAEFRPAFRGSRWTPQSWAAQGQYMSPVDGKPLPEPPFDKMVAQSCE
ncbi:MAG: ABC transporter substrate-binding protein [Burkholderiaceae bacterium]